MNLARLSHIAFLTLPRFSMIPVANAIEVLRMANRTAGSVPYRWSVVTPDGAPTAASNGLGLTPTEPLAAIGRPDILFVCGGIDVRTAADRPLLATLRRLARDGVPLGGLCTGTFALAAAGLLHGRNCAIHWENIDAVAEEFPDVTFVRHLFAIDRDRITCTGGVASLSLIATIVEARLGPAIAAEIRAQFLIERVRDGSEAQRTRPSHPKLEPALRAIEASLDSRLATATLAETLDLSTRQLERLFRQHLGQTPAAYAAGLRLDRARALLRETALPVTEIATACGYLTPSRFSAAYRDRFGCPPRAERNLKRAERTLSQEPAHGLH